MKARALMSLCGLLFVVPLFQNCSEASFKKGRPVQEQKVLEEFAVFDDLPPLGDTEVPFNRVCGMHDEKNPKTVLNSNSLKAVMYDASDRSRFCELTNTYQIRKSIVDGSNLEFPGCEFGNEVNVEIEVEGDSGKTLLVKEKQLDAEKVEDGRTFTVFNYINKALFGTSTDQKRARKSARTTRPLNVVVGSYSPRKDHDKKSAINGTDKECDNFDSPLFIDMRPRGSERDPSKMFMGLTPKYDGIWFDIIGRSAAHVKQQISWIESPEVSSHFMFIVLPDENGEVKGIDQMFGNNTLGPDNRYSTNGFTALRKWDGLWLSRDKIYVNERNGQIDRGDPIFTSLRLWHDRNVDGVASPSELLTFDQAGITRIDLNYDPYYYERDRHGNEVRYKSIVEKSDGELTLVFDLWFKY